MGGVHARVLGKGVAVGGTRGAAVVGGEHAPVPMAGPGIAPVPIVGPGSRGRKVVSGAARQEEEGESPDEEALHEVALHDAAGAVRSLRDEGAR